MDNMNAQSITNQSSMNNDVSKAAIIESTKVDNEQQSTVTNTTQDREVKVHGGKCYEFIKRTFDIFSSGLFLILFGWLMLLLMLIKWFEDLGVKSYKLNITENEKGKYHSKNGKRYDCKLVKDPDGKKDPTVHGPIYTSIRVGKNGKLFKFHKIRSMCPGAEAMKLQLLEYGINEADAPAFKLKDDPRITKFGKFIRKTSLDELPQIWDIFVGRLSVVGPRSPLQIEVHILPVETKTTENSEERKVFSLLKRIIDAKKSMDNGPIKLIGA